MGGCLGLTIAAYLEKYCEEVSAFEFYRDIFPQGHLETKGVYCDGQYNGIAVSVNDEEKKVRRYTVTDDLNVIKELGEMNDFSIMSPISYAGKSRKSENARFMYALAIDLDGIKMDIVDGEPVGMWTLFYQFDGNGPSDYLPKPTYIVSSGTGIHLYYVFDRPIPLFKNIVKQLERYKKRLTWQLWTQGVSELKDKVQYESLFQGFRVVGTVTKRGDRARAFRVGSGEKVSVDYLNRFVPAEWRMESFDYVSKLPLEIAKTKYPEWYEKRIKNGEPKGRWVCKKDLYEWWKRRLEEGAEDGHRYWCIHTLAIYAMKCGVPRSELENDAYGYIEMLDKRGKRTDNPFTSNDVLKALEAYNDSYVTYPIEAISDRTGIRIERNKRNGRKRKDHLYVMRVMKTTKLFLNEREALGGRPDKAEIVAEWRKSNPAGRKADCIRETGLSKPTVYKWWEETCK